MSKNVQSTRSRSALPDSREVLIAGEHEDYYDPDFYIYSDVVVRHPDGRLEIFGYPKEVFPPTDFHSATLFDDHILLIGSLGYIQSRKEGETQVLRLNLGDFSVEPVATTGDNPGWIHRHKAALEGGKIAVTGGKLEPGYRDNTETFTLDLTTWEWSRT